MSFDIHLAKEIVTGALPRASWPRFDLPKPGVRPAVELAELLRDPIRAGYERDEEAIGRARVALGEVLR